MLVSLVAQSAYKPRQVTDQGKSVELYNNIIWFIIFPKYILNFFSFLAVESSVKNLAYKT